MIQRTYCVSDFTRIFTDKTTSIPRLDMRWITDSHDLPSFAALRDHVVVKLLYSKPQADKAETNAWVPTLYEVSDRTFVNSTTGRSFTKRGEWRSGAAEAEKLSVFIADVDNADTGRPIISVQAVAAALDAMGVSYFMYTSFSHTPEKPKFRVIVDTDRDLTRTEMLRIAVWLNAVAFGGQTDFSIYDPGDFLFAPPHVTTVVERLHARPMGVDDALTKQTLVQQERPGIWNPYLLKKEPRPPRTLRTPAQTAAACERCADRAARLGIGIDNPAIFNRAWLPLYKACIVGGSHYETMRSLLGMVWAKTGGKLSYGEMDRLLRQIDATDSDHFIRVHGEQKAAALLDWIMRLPVEEIEEDWTSIVDTDEIGLTVLVKEGECGEGKTHDELVRIAREGGRTVYVVDKIETIDKRREEFFEIAGPRTAVRFRIEVAHSQRRDLRVPLQLFAIRKKLDEEPAGRPAIVFVTQAAAAQMDWSEWGDCTIVYDEVPDIFEVFRIDAANHRDVLCKYVRPETEDGVCYSLGLTAAGRDLARATDVDDYDKVHHGLCVLLAKANTYVWVKRKAWDDPADGGRLEFFAIVSPLNLSAFKAVRLLGDEATKSVTVKAWSEKWGVKFEEINFARRQRIVPTSDRVTIRYFSRHRDSSLTRFREGDMPLEAVSAWIKQDAGGEPVLWTANERLRAKSKLDQREFISPKAHGRNDLQQYKRVAWLAAMKASQFEIGTLREVCGMTAQELIDWREYNALYQFMMRCVLRDFSSAEPVVLYVFSKRQAEYLHGRLGGRIEHVPGVIIDMPVRSLDMEGAMTDAERSKVAYWRKKMAVAGVADVRLLPKSAKLSEREVRLMNATFERSPTGRSINKLVA
ncbi:hypothetical protein [Methylobacterium sp. J-077]|uniref:hypothetical protein n=1 Tax=Methylobacterium sp. J-077 TaxID=2836656 RepID=UPI001FB96893|nr:hypothetical protein [Methylobacterium sp. J-077]MCJ2124927.1 hypothetical protein [Methylobacterium sp. J-077]